LEISCFDGVLCFRNFASVSYYANAELISVVYDRIKHKIGERVICFLRFDNTCKLDCKRQTKYILDGCRLHVLTSPGVGRKLWEALDGNIGESGQNVGQVVAHWEF